MESFHIAVDNLVEKLKNIPVRWALVTVLIESFLGLEM